MYVLLLIFVSILILFDGAVIGYFNHNPQHQYSFLMLPAGILMTMLGLFWLCLIFWV